MEELVISSESLGSGLDAPRRARAAARRFLLGLGLDHCVDDILLVISELVTNSVLHAQAAPDLVLRRDAAHPCVTVEVRDPSPVLPIEREPDLTVKGGRGIRLVSAIADKWGVEVRGAAGKTIWAQFTAAPA